MQLNGSRVGVGSDKVASATAMITAHLFAAFTPFQIPLICTTPAALCSNFNMVWPRHQVDRRRLMLRFL
jgi:hypothetical protein